MPTDRVRAADHDRDRSLGWLAAAWIEHFCVHGPGDIQGTSMNPAVAGSIPLSDELTKLTVDSYSLDRAGRRLYDSVFYSRPKGCDKSGQSARFAQFEGLGPCRFGGWAEGGEVFEQMDFRYRYRRGEAMGRPVTYPFLRIMATEEGQTGNVYDAIYYSLREGPLREAFVREDDIGLTRTFLPGGGEIRPSTASSSAKDGGRESFVSFDETHLYTTPELWRMYSTVRRNLAKRLDAEPWSFEPSTMYQTGRGSVAERSHDLARLVHAGKAKGDRLLFDHRYAAIDDGFDFDDEDALRRALAEAYGEAASYMPIDRLVSEFYDPRNDREDSIQFFLNNARTGSGRAFSIERWRELSRPEHVIPDGALVTLGFDGSLTDDATAIVATEVATGHQAVVGVWENPRAGDDWQVPRHEVDTAVDAAFERWDVWRMYCDPPYWEGPIAAWAGRHGEKRVIEFRTNRLRLMATVLQAYATAIAGGELSHDGHEAFARHIGNACRSNLTARDEEGRALWVIQKERPGSPHKIDLAMAGCLSWEARNDAIASGALNKEEEVEFHVYALEP